MNLHRADVVAIRRGGSSPPSPRFPEAMKGHQDPLQEAHPAAPALPQAAAPAIRDTLVPVLAGAEKSTT